MTAARHFPCTYECAYTFLLFIIFFLLSMGIERDKKVEFVKLMFLS